MTKLTRQLKRNITNDWKQRFPQMGEFEPMWLMRRIGPVVQGICLNRSSTGTDYIPITHIYDLCAASTSIKLAMAQRLRAQRSGAPNPIQVRLHDQLFQEAADRLERASLLPLSGGLSAMDFARAFQRYRGLNESTSRSPVYYFESAVRLLAWTGRIDEGRQLLATYVHELSTNDSISDAPSDLDAWELSMLRLLSAPESVRTLAAEQAVALKVDRLPTSALS